MIKRHRCDIYPILSKIEAQSPKELEHKENHDSRYRNIKPDGEGHLETLRWVLNLPEKANRNELNTSGTTKIESTMCEMRIKKYTGLIKP